MADIDTLRQQLTQLQIERTRVSRDYSLRMIHLQKQLLDALREKYTDNIYCIHGQGIPLNIPSNEECERSHDVCYYSTLEKAQAAMKYETSKSEWHSWTYSIVTRNAKKLSDLELLCMDSPPPRHYPCRGDD